MERTGLILLATALVVTAGAVDSEGAGDRVKYVECSDGTLCPDRTTCCLLYGHRYACCPYQSAQCCSDNLHCCPRGYKCDTANGTCVHAFRQQHLFSAQALEPVTPAPRRSRHRNVQVGDIRCPDGNYCLDGQTCCLLTSGSYGCCPYQYAQCCSDHSSCCPEGYQCKISTHQCIHATTNHILPMLGKVEPVVRNTERVVSNENEVSEVGNIRCPDGNYCLEGQTCCLLTSGSYGCCPYQHAQCCSDHSSCCPEGYRCKVSTHQCLHATTNHTLPMLRKVDPIVRDSEPASRTGSSRPVFSTASNRR